MIFGPKADPAADTHCHSTIAAVQNQCDDNVSSKYGNDYTWTVSNDGKYDITVTPPSGKTYPLYAEIVVKNAAGEVVSDTSGDYSGEVAKAALDLKAGTYTVTVKDTRSDSIKGGYDYKLEIASPTQPGDKAVAAADGAAGAAEANAPPIQIDAAKLAAEMMTKQAHYDGKILEVKGLVDTVSNDVDMTMVIFTTPSSPNGEATGVTATLPAKSKVKKGQVITVRGLANDDDSGIILTGAELVANGKQVAAAAAPKGKAAPAKGAKK
jgi:hypothetical protein